MITIPQRHPWCRSKNKRCSTKNKITIYTLLLTHSRILHLDPPDQLARVPKPFSEHHQRQEADRGQVPSEQVEHRRPEVLQILRDLLLLEGASGWSHGRRKHHLLAGELLAQV